LNLTGRHDQAIEEAARARDLDPLAVFINAIKGERTLHAGRFEEALADLHRTVAMDPGHFYTRLLLGWTYASMQRPEDAIPAFEAAVSLSSREPMAVFSLANAYWVTGRRDEADELLRELEERAEQRFIPPHFFFSMYKTRGDLDRAFEWFEKGVEERDFMMVFCESWPGEVWQIPNEPRFHEAFARLKNPAE
jgi:tetratricopeptide (TPR) repeat protein